MLVESVCLESVQVRAIPEYLDSRITRSDFPKNLRLAKNQGFADHALYQATKWLEKGVRIHLTRANSKLNSCGNLCGIIFSFGALKVLENPLVTILNSRISSKIGPNTPWIIKTIELTRYAIEHKLALVSSYGTIPYLMVSWLVRGTALVVVCNSLLPFMDDLEIEEKFRREFSDIFDLKTTLFLSGFMPGILPKPKQRNSIRDEIAGSISEIMLPCEVRPNGNMSRILKSALDQGKIIRNIEHTLGTPDEHFEEPSSLMVKSNPQNRAKKSLENRGKECSHDSSSFKISGDKSPSIFDDQAVSFKGDLLIHYTRACKGPWPGQPWSEYLESLTLKNPDSSHNALETLRRILDEKRIRACDKWTRGSIPVVSFTERTPEEFHLISRWRRGLMRQNFEPYGIAFIKEALVNRGARKVIYGSEENYKNLLDETKTFFQLSTSSGLNWSEEREWRFRGDLEFTDMLQNEWFAIVPNDDDANSLITRAKTREFRVFVLNPERPTC